MFCAFLRLTLKSKMFAHFRWCKCNFNFAHSGITALKHHILTKKHKAVADQKKGRNRSQATLVSCTSGVNNNSITTLGSSATQSSSTSSQGPSGTAPAPAPKIITITDQINKAEAILVMKGVESQWSYASYDNLTECLKAADPRSEVFAKLKLGRHKVSKIVSHGLAPFYRNKIIKSVLNSGGFTLCTDSATFRQAGVSKHVDLVLVWWCEVAGEVRTEFVDYHSVGHETSGLQVDNMEATLGEMGLSMATVIAISRDNPTVQQAMSRKLMELAKDKGNPGMLDLKCYLHPAHTAFQMAVQELNVDITQALVCMHSFFKLSTGRREDRTLVQKGLKMELGEEFGEAMDRFYLRHVSSRWLELGPVVIRLLELWESTYTYFMVYLPESTVQANKNSLKSKG